jgi:hypothetical protein
MPDGASMGTESREKRMVTLSADDKAKGKRIITQFFRTMPGVQKSLLTLFDKDGYDGVHRLQKLMYPDASTPMDSIDTLRKGLSMILQHIYGMPVEDKEGYFQDIVKCKTANQVVRKEKETLVNYFYDDFPTFRDAFRDFMVEDRDFLLMNVLCKKFLGDETEDVGDMRGFKNQIRNLREVLSEQISSGLTEKELIEVCKEKKAEVDAQPAPAQHDFAPTAEEDEASPAPPGFDDQASAKRRIISDVLNDGKYAAIRDVLLQTTLADPNFGTFQAYLDNILAPSARVIANNLESFSHGVEKIKAFRDNLERELAS